MLLIGSKEFDKLRPSSDKQLFITFARSELHFQMVGGERSCQNTKANYEFYKCHKGAQKEGVYFLYFDANDKTHLPEVLLVEIPCGVKGAPSSTTKEPSLLVSS